MPLIIRVTQIGVCSERQRDTTVDYGDTAHPGDSQWPTKQLYCDIW